MDTRPLACLASLALSSIASAQTIELTLDAPSLDRWMYPFNGMPGTRPSASLFGFTAEGDDFDNRDGQMLIGFQTTPAIPSGLDPASYTITTMSVAIEYDGQHTVIYDDSVDPFNAFLPSDDPEFIADADPGQPLELFGVGYRNGFTAETFTETTSFGSPFGHGVRNAFAMTIDERGLPMDVSNSVRDGVTPTPWAIGIIDGLAAGATVPNGAEWVFDVDLDDPEIHAVFAAQLAAGDVRVAITTLSLAEQQAGEFPTVFTKENPLVAIGVASAARLTLTVTIGGSADFDGDGTVGTTDLLILLGMWGSCAECPADLNNDGVVGVEDLLELLSLWG